MNISLFWNTTFPKIRSERHGVYHLLSTNSGTQIWEKLVKPAGNIGMVLIGHY